MAGAVVPRKGAFPSPECAGRPEAGIRAQAQHSCEISAPLATQTRCKERTIITEDEASALFQNPDLFKQQNYVGRWKRSAFKRWAAGQEREPDLTAALAAASGSLADVLIRTLRHKADLEYRPAVFEYRLIGTGDEEFGFKSAWAPDVFVTRRARAGASDSEAAPWIHDLAVEVKRGAGLNGTRRREGGKTIPYCPTHELAGTQLLCYVEGCWIPEQVADRPRYQFAYLFAAPLEVLENFPSHVRFSWSSDELHSPTKFKEWGEVAVRGKALEETAIEQWRTISLGLLADAIDEEFPECGELEPLTAALRKRR